MFRAWLSQHGLMVRPQYWSLPSEPEPGLLAGLCGEQNTEGWQMPPFRVPVAAVGREKAGVGFSILKGIGRVPSLLVEASCADRWHILLDSEASTSV